MADASTNPYLALLQQEAGPPSWAQVLQHIGNLGFGLAGGFGQAAATGQPTMAAIGPGLMMGNQMNAQAAHQAEQERMKRLELQFQAQAYEDKRDEVRRKQRALEEFAKTGFNVAPPQPQLMGPGGTPQGGGYDTRVAGLEGGTKKGGMVFNELGSGAYGPYQFMPATWAAVRAQNPSLNLPEDITQASREQHDAAHNAFKAGNAQGLQAAGFQPTPENLYLAHRFGLGGATSVLRADQADPNKLLSEVLPIDWQRQNPDMRGQTVGGFRRLAAERVGGSSVPYVVRPDAKPTQYSLMPDDVPLSLSSGETTLPRPSTAEPSFTAPVMPQPTWDAPSDIARVNPGSWFPPPAAPPPVPGQPPPAPAPGTPTPGGPNVVQAQATPGPNTPPMVAGGGPAPGVDAPPTRPVTPMPQPDPAFLAQVRAGVAGGIIKPEDGMAMLRQHVMDRYKQADDAVGAQHATALEVYKQRQESQRHERGLAEQKAARDAAIADEQRKHERGRTEEGEWVRGADGIERLVAKKDLTPGMTRIDKPSEPPAGYRRKDDGSYEVIPGGPADAAAKAGEAKRGDEQTKAQRDQENKLRDDFNGLKPVQDFRKADLVFQSAQNAAKTDTAAADLNLVYAFATMMDPGSVVRDQETGMVIATQNATDRVKALIASVSGGSRLSPESKKALIAEMGSRHSGYKEAHDAYATATEEIATRQGLDPRNVVARVVVKKPTEEKPATPPSDTFPAPPPAAIKALQMAPNQREDFDKMFGPGAAAKVLGR